MEVSQTPGNNTLTGGGRECDMLKRPTTLWQWYGHSVQTIAQKIYRSINSKKSQMHEQELKHFKD